MIHLKLFILSIIVLPKGTFGELEISTFNQNLSEMAIALSEMAQGLKLTKTITILNPDNRKSNTFNEFIMEIHRLQLETCIFNETVEFFKFIEANLKGSIEVTALIFHNPDELIEEIHDRNLAHRLSLYIFFWNAKHLPGHYKNWNLHDPLRAAFITNPRYFVYRIYYNQATSSNDGTLKLVNWFDGNNLNLNSEPLLPSIKSIHKTFNGRRFIIPVIHSPPWIFINYINHKSASTSSSRQQNLSDNDNYFDDEYKSKEMKREKFFQVSGRDDTLLKLLAQKMNFKYEYIDVKAIEMDENVTVAGALGLQMLQKREADFLFGDIVVTYERMQEVEFSFFTLPDSGAFLTHAPRRLSEALALVYPFQMEVWPVVIFTVLITGPILYLMIIIPELFLQRQGRRKRKKRFEHSKTFYNMIYIKEITKGKGTCSNDDDDDGDDSNAVKSISINGRWKKLLRLRGGIKCRKRQLKRDGLFARCVWFTCHIFLRQSTNFPHENHSVRFFSIVLWFSATYVLSDLYSAQLTSQLARPSKELPIKSLHRLEYVLNSSGGRDYKLLVERDSASHNVLLNGTGIVQRLYRRMTQQSADNSTYLLESVEQGVRSLLANDKTVVFAGRQTLYFNMKRYGSRNFQLSEKLFTRYSAMALQKGCLFLDSLNDNLMKLFEGGILDKITSDEYEKMFQSMQLEKHKNDESDSDNVNENEDEMLTKFVSANGNSKKASSDEKELKALSLQMLQGAFYLAIIGYTVAFLVLLIEIGCEHFDCRKLSHKLRIWMMRINRTRLW